MTALSAAVRRRIPLVFRPEDCDAAAAALVRTNFGMATWDDYHLDRLRFAVMKLSGGALDALSKWIAAAEGHGDGDWRDVLVTAGFADRVESHAAWLSDGSDEWPGAERG